MPKQSVRSSKAMFSVIPAPLFSLPGLSVAFCAAYSPFHCCCPLHFTIFWAFLSTDIQAKGEINGFCGKKLCHRIVAFSHEREKGVILWAKRREKNVEKPLDVLQDLYQKTDLVRSILSLLLDAMIAGCDPWKTPYVVTISHMAEMWRRYRRNFWQQRRSCFERGERRRKRISKATSPQENIGFLFS